MGSPQGSQWRFPDPGDGSALRGSEERASPRRGCWLVVVNSPGNHQQPTTNH
ncbi:MAG: hypothetical protein ACHBN1_14010 [Heteroscytonema crispum UTEX LB 1556]